MFEFFRSSTQADSQGETATMSESTEPPRMTWTDFPDFVKKVQELARVRAIHEENLLVLRRRMSSFDVDVAGSAAQARLDTKIEAMKSGVQATLIAEPTLHELQENVTASGILVARQMSVVKTAHMGVKQEIGHNNLERWRSIVARNRDAVLELQAAINDMRSMRTEILTDCGDGEEWGSRGAIEGGIGQPSGMVAPLSLSCFKGESDFVHLLRGQVSHFADAAELYLENSSNA
jgi:hypothetical protein